jgi:thiol-disulfide isomerase/thioredoxin
MKKATFCIFILMFCVYANGQKAVIKVRFESSGITELVLSRPSQEMSGSIGRNGSDRVISIENGEFSIALSITAPEIMFLAGNDPGNKHFFSQPLFIKAGYRLNMHCRLIGDEFTAITAGTGSNDNEHWAISDFYSQMEKFREAKDTVPDKALDYLMAEYAKDSIGLQKYIANNKPSEEFVNAWKYELQYKVLDEYYEFAESQKYPLGDAYKRNLALWKKPVNEILSRVPLSNDEALIAPSYISFLESYLRGTKESINERAVTDPNGVLKEWYGRGDRSDPAELYEDMDNLLRQKIVEKQFTGKAKEYMYALILEHALTEELTANMEIIYPAFNKQFPESRFHERFDEPVLAMLGKLHRSPTDKMIFIGAGQKQETFEDILTLMKGKTVLLDMWGTWCGPCRQEIAKNGAALKKYFKGKGLDYLYIANFDEGREKKWKEIISYLDMEGHHLIASEKLTKDIMGKLKSSGYPTYAIIRRDGSFELSKAGYPLKREKLIEQIENTLKN